MTKDNSRHLLDMLALVPDPNKEKGKRHPLKAILALAVIAMMSGSRSYAAIAEYGRTYKMLRKALDFRHKKTPCAATLYNLFRRLDIDALEETLKPANRHINAFRQNTATGTKPLTPSKHLKKHMGALRRDD